MLKKVKYFLMITFVSILFLNIIEVKADENLNFSYSLDSSSENVETDEMICQYNVSLQNLSDNVCKSWEICFDFSEDLVDLNINQISTEYFLKDGNLYLKGLDILSKESVNSMITLQLSKSNSLVNAFVSSNDFETIKTEEVSNSEEGIDITVEENLETTIPNTETVTEEVVFVTEEVVFVPEDYIGQDIKTIKDSVKSLCENNGVAFKVNYEYSDSVNEDIIINQVFENKELVLKVSLGKQPVATPMTRKASNSANFGLVSGKPITIDGNFDDWNDKPYSFEYNWDNSNNCWEYGVWVGGTCYKTPVGTYSTDVRHKVQLYCDGTYVYLHIVFSTDYQSYFNGENYVFTIDGQSVRMQISDNVNGVRTLTGVKQKPGKKTVYVHHGDTRLSSTFAIGSEAIYTIHNSENKNNEIELKIPVSELKRQNSKIDAENFSEVTWESTNLTYRTVSISCTPTSSYIFVILITLTAFASYFYIYKKGKMKS